MVVKFLRGFSCQKHRLPTTPVLSWRKRHHLGSGMFNSTAIISYIFLFLLSYWVIQASLNWGRRFCFVLNYQVIFFLFLKENNAERLLKEKQTAAGAGLVCMCHHPLSNSTARSTRRRSQTWIRERLENDTGDAVFLQSHYDLKKLSSQLCIVGKVGFELLYHLPSLTVRPSMSACMFSIRTHSRSPPSIKCEQVLIKSMTLVLMQCRGLAFYVH